MEEIVQVKNGKKKKRKVWKWIVISIVIFLILLGIFLAYTYQQVTDTAKEIYEPIEDREASDKRDDRHVEVKKSLPFSVLILGVDERENDAGRSDTMIVMTVNPTLGSSKMVSIPRDTYTEIVGKGIKDKINHSYAFGGVRMAKETTEELLDIPIDYVVQVNMEGFKEIVDAVGGIEVNNGLPFESEGFQFPKGSIGLNGEEALAFVRMRYEDPDGDFGRQNRQKQVIQAIISEGISVNSVLKLNAILEAVGENVRTNMTYAEIRDVPANYRSAAGHIDQLYFESGTSSRIDGIWYYLMDEQELVTVSDELKDHLNLEE